MGLIIMAKTNIPPMDEKTARLQALQMATAKIEKDFGKGSIMRLGGQAAEKVDVIPTGSIGLNAALGVGGYPRGRIIEIFGPESSGKTTLTIHAIAEAQKAGGIAAFIDAEHAFDPTYAQKLGVNLDELWISQPDNGEQYANGYRGSECIHPYAQHFNDYGFFNQIHSVKTSLF